MKKILIVLAVLFIGIQFIPVERTNPPVTQEIDAPSYITAILRKSCFDCHSNYTEWPWYSYVAPVSFLVADDVTEGRRHLNFSEWDKYDKKKRERVLEAMIEEIEKGKMPLPMYTFTHPDAKIDPLKTETLKNWVNKKGGMGKTLRQEKERSDDN